jgi:hypothetical protein
MTMSHLEPVKDEDDFVLDGSEPRRPAPMVARPAAPHERSIPPRVLAIGVAVAILAVAGAGAWLARSGRAVEAPPGPSHPTVAVAGFAELYVATFLTAAGSGGTLDAFTPRRLPEDAMAPNTRYVTGTAAIAVEEVDADYWSVTVAADVLDLGDDGYVPAGIQYFQVGVIEAEGRLTAPALPARVAGPEAAPQAPLALVEGPADPEMATLANGFFDALLVGGSELGRYVTPSSRIVAVVPHPFESVDVDDLRVAEIEGATLMRAVVTGTTSAGATEVLDYTVEIERNSDVWLVSAVLPGVPVVGGPEGG